MKKNNKHKISVCHAYDGSHLEKPVKGEMQTIATVNCNNAVTISEDIALRYNYYKDLVDNLKDVVADLFYQIEAKIGAQKANEYPSIKSAKLLIENLEKAQNNILEIIRPQEPFLFSIDSILSKTTGYPISWYKEEYQLKKDNFCTLREFINNPDTVEQFRYMNSYQDNVFKFSSDVYEYLDSIYCSPEEAFIRKELRRISEQK